MLARVPSLCFFGFFFPSNFCLSGQELPNSRKPRGSRFVKRAGLRKERWRFDICEVLLVFSLSRENEHLKLCIFFLFPQIVLVVVLVVDS